MTQILHQHIVHQFRQKKVFYNWSQLSSGKPDDDISNPNPASDDSNFDLQTLVAKLMKENEELQNLHGLCVQQTAGNFNPIMNKIKLEHILNRIFGW